ncbi:MAG: RNase adapter RapZ [Synergistaceae bacterium]|nr:RNase adapter RapZ [Synergistaceae bacterium]
MSCEQKSNFNKKIKIYSFGFKYETGFIAECVFDARFLPNPFWEPSLKQKSGLDKGVQDFVKKSEDFESFVDLIVEATIFYLKARKEKEEIKIAIGCTGGRHRSVTVAVHVAQTLESKGYLVEVTHQDIDNDLGIQTC